MKEVHSYKKGIRVWVEILVEGIPAKPRLAEVISEVKNSRPFGDEKHTLVRYLDVQGADAYECISSNRIIGIEGQEEQQ